MENMPKKYIIDVAILTRIPLTRQQFFSYLHHEPIPEGSLVLVPLFRHTIQGVVLATRSDFHRLGNFELKKIQSVLAENFLNPQQLELAHKLSEHYISPLGIILKQFVPKRVKARTQLSTADEQNTTNKKQITLTKEQEASVSKLTDTESYKLKVKSYLLFGPSSCGKTEVYLEAISRILQNDPTAQFLILVPELTLAADIIQRVTSRFGNEKLAVLHSNVSDGAYFRDWERIRSGEASIIIGTRMAVFAPFKKLSLIIVDEEQDVSYKQWDMNPRYDARTAAKKLSRIFDCPLVACSATPRVETFHESRTGESALLELPPLDTPQITHRPLQVSLVDMRKERWKDFAGKKKPNYSCVSRELASELHFVLSHKRQAILFINHQGMNSFTICAECKEVLRCPQCQRTLVYNESGTYKCLHCNYDSGAFTKCSKCGSLQFNNIGIGTQTVEREIKKRFFSARIARADNRTMKNTNDQEIIFRNFLEGKIDILIGTQMITKGWDIPNVSLVGIIDADSLLSIPDISTDERAVQHIMQAAGRTGRPGSIFAGKVIIQTFDPNNTVVKAAAGMDYGIFCEKELVQREALRYPPFGRFIRLICQNSDQNALEKEVKITYDRIVAALENNNEIRILGPDKPLVHKVRAKYRIQILISLRKKDLLVPQGILKQLHKFGSNWIIDVDPISII